VFDDLDDELPMNNSSTSEIQNLREAQRKQQEHFRNLASYSEQQLPAYMQRQDANLSATNLQHSQSPQLQASLKSHL